MKGLWAAIPIASLLLAFAIVPSCGGGGPSKVGQGQQYTSGDPNFDQFFGQLFELQVAMGKALQSEKEIRAGLSKKLGADPNLSATLLAKQVEKRAKELAEGGTGLKLEVTGLELGEAPSAKMSSSGKDLDGGGMDFANAVQQAAEDEAKLIERMRKARKQLDVLLSQSFALDQHVDATFRLGGASKKNEVRSNLKDARTLIPLMASRSDEVVESAMLTIKKLVEASNTDDGSFTAPPPTPPMEGDGGVSGADAGAPAPAVTKPGGTGPKPPPPPPPPPSDFEP